MWLRILTTIASVFLLIAYNLPAEEMVSSGVSPTGLLRPPLLEFILLSPLCCLYLFFRQPTRLWAAILLCFGVLAALYPLIFTPLMMLWSGQNTDDWWLSTPDIEPLSAGLVVFAGLLNMLAAGLVLRPRFYWIASSADRVTALAPMILITIGYVLILLTFFLVPVQFSVTSADEAHVQYFVAPPLWLLYVLLLIPWLYCYFKKPGLVWAVLVFLLGVLVVLFPWLICLIPPWSNNQGISMYYLGTSVFPVNFLFPLAGICITSAASWVLCCKSLSRQKAE